MRRNGSGRGGWIMDEERKEDRNCIECEKGEKVGQRGKQNGGWTMKIERCTIKKKEKDLQRE